MIIVPFGLFNCGQVLRFANNLMARVHSLSEKVASLENEQKGAVERLVLATQEKDLAETETEEKEKATDLFKSEVMWLQTREVNQEALVKTAVKKVMQTVEFGELAVKLSNVAMSIGTHKILKLIIEECPQLSLRKKRQGWNPYAQN